MERLLERIGGIIDAKLEEFRREYVAAKGTGGNTSQIKPEPATYKKGKWKRRGERQGPEPIKQKEERTGR